MKNKNFISVFALTALLALNSCAAPALTSPVSDAAGQSSYPYPEPSASAAPVASGSGLGNLQAGVIADTTLTEEEQKLAGLLERKVNPEFPLKLGVILYSNNYVLDEKYRKQMYDNLLSSLKSNGNIAQIIEISPDLTTSASTLEDLRKLGARFQVSTLLVVSDKYQYPQENKEIKQLPIELITGIKAWESFSTVDAYALDILNGVFVFSTSSGIRLTAKYNKEDPIKNKDSILIKDSATQAWEKLEEKVNTEINDYKTRLDNKSP